MVHVSPCPWRMSMSMPRVRAWPDCPSSDQSSTGRKNTNDAGTGTVPGQAKPMKSGIFLVRYRTEIMNAEMPGRR